MAENSAIEWTDHTFNPWEGCAKVHAGCQHCYAETRANRFGKVEWGPRGTRMLRSEGYWIEPCKWNRQAEAEGVRRKVFCASLADVFEDWTGRVIDHRGEPIDETIANVRRKLFALIDATPWLDWIVLTKRPENVRSLWKKPDVPCCERDHNSDGDCDRHPDGRRDNVWLLTSVSDQATADRMVPKLLKCRDLVPVLGVSCEPLLGPIDFDGIGNALFDREAAIRQAMNGPQLLNRDQAESVIAVPQLDWVIAGGESGTGARPMHPDWARGLRDQCDAAGVPFFFKQWGEWAPYELGPAPMLDSQHGDSVDRHTLPDLTDHEPVAGWWWPPHDPTTTFGVYRKVGKKAAGDLLDGVRHHAWPASDRATTPQPIKATP